MLAGEQDLAGAVIGHFSGPFDAIDTGGLAPAVGENLPARRLVGAAHPLGVDGHDNALGAKATGGGAHEFRVFNGG